MNIRSLVLRVRSSVLPVAVAAVAALGFAATAAHAASLNINVGTPGTTPSPPLIDGDGSCPLDGGLGGQNNNQICTNDIARYRVQYQAIGPAPSTNLTITAGPLPADFRWSKNAPGMGSCLNSAASRISADGKSLTCVVATSGLVSGALDFDVTTDKTAQNGSSFADVTFNLNNDEDSPATAGGVKSDTALGVTVIAQPRVDAYKLLYSTYFGILRPTYSTFTANNAAVNDVKSGSPLCAGTVGAQGVLVAFRIGGNATQLKGHERLGNTITFTDDLSGFPTGSCIADIYPLSRMIPGDTSAAIAAGAAADFNGTWSWTQTAPVVNGVSGAATITVTNADTSGTYPFSVGANTNTVIGGWARVWVPVAAIQDNGGSVAGKNMLRDFDPVSVSGVSNFGGTVGTLPSCPLSAADADTVEPDYCATNLSPANVTNQAAWGPIVLGRGDFGKYYQQTSQTFATTVTNGGDYPYLTNDWIGPGDKLDSFVVAGNTGALPVTASLCDKWDNRKLGLITVDPATVKTHAGTGPVYSPNGNAA